jgi:hypothetical protein
MNVFPNKSKGESHIFGWKFFLSGTVFCASHTTPIHETLIKAKASLLNVVKKIKFGAKIALTSISLSFINSRKSANIHSTSIISLDI